jgi:hypothetical protein
MNSGLHHALEAGRLLIEAKKLCPHGQFSPWIAENFEGSDRTARAYMQVAKRWPEVAQNGNGVADLTYGEVLRLVAEPRSTPEPDGDETEILNAELLELQDDSKEISADEAESFEPLPKPKDAKAFWDDVQRVLMSLPEFEKMPAYKPDTNSDETERVLWTADLDWNCYYQGFGDINDDFLVELFPHEQAGYFQLSVSKGLNGEKAFTIYDKVGCKYTPDLLAMAVVKVHDVVPTRWNKLPKGPRPAYLVDANSEGGLCEIG